ncbi:hypothetical protein [Marinobacter sp.]|uniref:hypothetical protein n=1 Tax=Marinobacter sp. TaxID=50741 RepID=UPI0034A3F5BE
MPLVIGLDVFRHGYKNTKESVGDLLDRRPHSLKTGKPEGLAEELDCQDRYRTRQCGSERRGV